MLKGKVTAVPKVHVVRFVGGVDMKNRLLQTLL
jgi:hypothetical protein